MSKPIILIAFLALLGALAAPAGAASPDAIIRDCSSSLDGELQNRYSRSDLRRALKDVTGDIAEYTNCSDAIRNAMRSTDRPSGGGNGSNATGGGSTGGGLGGGDGFGGGSTGGGAGGGAGGFGGFGGSGDGATGGGAAAPVPAPVTPQPGSSAPVKLAGTSITPSIPATLDRSTRELPTPLIGFLVLFGAGAIGVAATTIGRRVLARRRG